MKKNFKKLLSLVLALIMSLGALPLMPAEEVFANSAAGFTIRETVRGSRLYNIQLSFQGMPAAQANVAGNNPAAGPGATRLVDYVVRVTNHTRGGAPQDISIFEGATPIAGAQVPFTISSLPLEPGSVYTFDILPVMESAVLPPPAGGIPSSWTWGGPTSLGAAIARFSTLTNIEVREVVAETNGITLTWDHPGLFFEAVRISFQDIVHPPRSLTGNWGPNPQIPPVIVTPAMVSDNGATFTLTHPQIQAGRVYAVRIEPLVREGSSWVDRDTLRTRPRIDIPTVGTQLAFDTDTSLYYITDRAHVLTPLHIEPLTLTHMSLSFGYSAGQNVLAGHMVSSRINRVEIFREIDGVVELLQTIGVGAAGLSAPIVVERPQGSAVFFAHITYDDIGHLGRGSGNPVTFLNPPLVKETARAYYEPSDLEFSPFRPDITEIQTFPAGGPAPFSLQIWWRAFFRNPHNDVEIAEADENGRFIDRNVTYQIAITDDPRNFERGGIPVTTFTPPATGGTVPREIYGGSLYPHFWDTFTTFSEWTGTAFESRQFEQNRIYYVRIIAIRGDQESEPAYRAHYIMPIDRIPVNPNMMSRPPLRIKTITVDDVEVEDIGENHITIEWDEQWIEIFDPAEETWHSQAAISEGGTLLYGDNIGTRPNILQPQLDSTDFNADGTINRIAIKNRILATAGVPASAPLRLMDIRGSHYRIHVAEYETVLSFEPGGYQGYHDTIISNDSPHPWADDWDDIGNGTMAQQTRPITREHRVVTAHNPQADPLNSGTPYVIFLHPFAISQDGDNLFAYYPTYITATTLTARPDLEVTPTVPVLIPVDTTDTSVTVRWRYTPTLMYELVISEDSRDYPDGGWRFFLIADGEVWEDDEVNLTPDSRIFTDEETGHTYMEFTIRRLFPETMYYLWICSIAENTGGYVFSAWSNMLEMLTREIMPPPAPQGLGLASELSLDAFNRDNNTELQASGEDYLVIEWLRIASDILHDSLPPGTPSPSTDLASFLPNPTINQTYMVRFGDLMANRIYHVRAKTRLYITRDADGAAIRSYTYIVQLSLDPSFVDFVEIEVPVVGDVGNGLYRDSEWTTIALFTDISDGEYDGAVDPDMYPLPDRDFEYIWDNATQTLTYRFRSNQIDQQGNRDNLVDERFISRLVANRTFDFRVDVSSYGRNVPRTRVVEVPYSIVAAFNERQISLTVIADSFTVTFPHGSFMTPEARALNGLDRSATLRITIAENPTGIVAAATTNYVSPIHRLSATLTSSQPLLRPVEIVNFARPLNMSLTLSGAFVQGATNIGAYVQDGNSAGWQRLATNFDQINQSVSFTSQRAASFSAIGSMTPWAQTEPGQTQPETINQMHAVNSLLHITDLGVYNENAFVNLTQFNNVMAAALRRATSTNINVAVSAADIASLGNARLLVSGSGGAQVTREVAIDRMVRLFELRTRRPVTGFPSIAETSFTDIASASAEYRTSLLKAADLGFYRAHQANPRGPLTFGDLMHMLDIVLSY